MSKYPLPAGSKRTEIITRRDLIENPKARLAVGDFTAQVESINFELCICEPDFLLKHVSVVPCGIRVSGCECVYCRLAGRHRSVLAWPEGSQQLHNALQHRQRGLSPSCLLQPAARCLEKPLSSLQTSAQ